MAKEKENRQVEEDPPQELDNYLSRFLLSLRKKNGDEYEPSTLRGFIASSERYLKKCHYSELVITGQNFARTRDALKSKQKHLKRLGKGNKPNEASSLAPEERDKYLYLFFTVLCRAPSLHWSILNNELHLSGSRLYGMVLVYGMADSCLYNKQESHSISHSFAALTRSISM